jgi:hypothetical protein
MGTGDGRGASPFGRVTPTRGGDTHYPCPAKLQTIRLSEPISRTNLGAFGELLSPGIRGPESGEVLASDGEPDVIRAKNLRVSVIRGVVLPLTDGANLICSSRRAGQCQAPAADTRIEHAKRVPDGPLRRERDGLT